MPAPESPAPARRRPPRPRPAARRPKKLRCEACREVLSLRHAWDTATCSCGALLLSGRPTKPTVHWLSRPGGGWTEIDDDQGISPHEGIDQEPAPDAVEPDAERPARRLGFSRAAL